MALAQIFRQALRHARPHACSAPPAEAVRAEAPGGRNGGGQRRRSSAAALAAAFRDGGRRDARCLAPDNFDPTLDLTNNPTQIPGSFTFGDYPYGWSGFAGAGPFRGLSMLANDVYGLNADATNEVAGAPEVFGLDREVYLGTLLQGAENPRLRYLAADARKPSEILAMGDSTPGSPGLNESVVLPTWPKASYMSSDGLFASVPGARPSPAPSTRWRPSRTRFCRRQRPPPRRMSAQYSSGPAVRGVMADPRSPRRPRRLSALPRARPTSTAAVSLWGQMPNGRSACREPCWRQCCRIRPTAGAHWSTWTCGPAC